MCTQSTFWKLIFFLNVKGSSDGMLSSHRPLRMHPAKKAKTDDDAPSPTPPAGGPLWLRLGPRTSRTPFEHGRPHVTSKHTPSTALFAETLNFVIYVFVGASKRGYCISILNLTSFVTFQWGSISSVAWSPRGGAIQPRGLMCSFQSKVGMMSAFWQKRCQKSHHRHIILNVKWAETDRKWF